MKTLGYTFYPKDWNSSDAVFGLTLEERGFYRELIDLAMLNDNKTKVNVKLWGRKYNAIESVIQDILDSLLELELIEIEENIVFVPSCEKRLSFIRNGKKGGRPKGSKTNRKVKRTNNLIGKQRKKKEENKIEIENELLLNNCLTNTKWLKFVANSKNMKIESVKEKLIKFESDLRVKDDEKGNMKEFKNHFINWLNKQPSSTWKKPNYF
jgi:hypothetical protein